MPNVIIYTYIVHIYIYIYIYTNLSRNKENIVFLFILSLIYITEHEITEITKTVSAVSLLDIYLKFYTND
jgi:hypothetical protein